jgi:DNA ligase-1
MLGSITRSLNEVYTRLGTLPFTAEAKLDGQRVQVHARIAGPTGKPDGGGRWVVDAQNKRRVWVRLFSRHLEDMTEKYPDVCEMVASMLERGLLPVDARTEFPNTPGLTRPNEEMTTLWSTENVTSFVMDAEVVAVDKDTGAYRTFQELSNRAKKDVKLADVKVVVGVFAFDLMLLNDTVNHLSCRVNPGSHRIVAPSGPTILHSTASTALTLHTIRQPDRSHSRTILTRRIHRFNKTRRRSSILRASRVAEM